MSGHAAVIALITSSQIVLKAKSSEKGSTRAEMSDIVISRRLVLGGLALMLAGCTQATGAISHVFSERPLPDPRFQRQRVQYDGGESPGTIVVLVLAYAGLALFTLEFLVEDASGDTTWVAGVAVLLLLAALLGTGLVGFLRLVVLLGVRRASRGATA